MIEAASSAPRPLGELFSELASETGTLVRKEVELAQAELTVKAREAASCGLQIAIGTAVALGGGMVLMAALVIVLAFAVPLWASALLVGIVVSGAGAALVRAGVRRFKEIDVVPRRTLETLKDDRKWISEQVSR